MAIKSYKKNEQTFWIAMAKTRDRRGKQLTRRQSGIATEEQALKAETKLKAELLAMREGKKRYRWNDWVKHCLKKMKLQFYRSTLLSYETNLQKWVQHTENSPKAGEANIQYGTRRRNFELKSMLRTKGQSDSTLH